MYSGNQEFINTFMLKQNHKALDDFEGYSAHEMRIMLYNPFQEDCPFQLKPLRDHEYKTIPIFNQIRYLINIIQEQGELKLTQNGYLPPKIVKKIYAQGYMKEKYLGEEGFPLNKERDSSTVHLARIILQASPIVKKQHNKLSLTEKGKVIIAKNSDLLEKIFKSYSTKFNWAYQDRYADDKIGQLGFVFSLILLKKYGSSYQPAVFYAKKYLGAFPDLIDRSKKPLYGSPELVAAESYLLRTYERFMSYFGLIKIKENNDYKLGRNLYMKTALFDKLIKVLPHKER